MKNKIAKRYMVGAAVLGLIGCLTLGLFFYASSQQTDAAEEVETVVVSRQNLKKTLSLTGTIVPTESYSISSEIADSSIQKICVKVGDRVKEGDVIAVLDPANIEQSLALANSNLEVIKQKNALDVESARRAYDNAVSQAADLAVRRTEEEAKAREEANKAQNELAQALAKKDQYTTDQKSDNVDVNSVKNQVQRLTMDSRKAAKRVSEAESEYEEATTERDERKLELETAQSKLEAALAEDGSDQSQLQSNVDAAKAAYEAADRRVETAKEKLETAKEDQTDSGNDLEDANKELTEVQDELSESKSKKAEADSKLETAKSDLQTAENNEKTAVYSLQDQQRENEKNIADSQDQITSAILSGKEGELSAQQEIEKYQAQIEKCTVKAPASGVITQIDVKEGESYKGTQIAMLSDDSGYKVQATADQYDISDIAMGMKTQIMTQTTGDEKMKGVLSFVSPTPKSASSNSDTNEVSANANQSASGYPVEASIEHPSERLRIGMTAKLTIILDKAKNALSLPENAIQTDADDREFVEVYEGDLENMKKIYVKRGLQTDYFVEVKGDGLEEDMNILLPQEMAYEEGEGMDDMEGMVW
ncbi:MAG: HlyD family efflux transporter periplasmic adaptor subunit [Lachnospiraceae bacterium]|nr:HlyD family efflux transporter periplasmic adaptor subunit [Lachnospiraceae bacterium]